MSEQHELEMAALRTIVEHLAALDPATRERVGRYVQARIFDPTAWPPPVPVGSPGKEGEE